MVSYIYFQNEQYLLDRFFIPEASKEDIQGLELWRNYIGKLISYLNTESESEKQETRETTIADLRKISDQTAGIVCACATVWKRSASNMISFTFIIGDAVWIGGY